MKIFIFNIFAIILIQGLFSTEIDYQELINNQQYQEAIKFLIMEDPFQEELSNCENIISIYQTMHYSKLLSDDDIKKMSDIITAYENRSLSKDIVFKKIWGDYYQIIFDLELKSDYYSQNLSLMKEYYDQYIEAGFQNENIFNGYGKYYFYNSEYEKAILYLNNVTSDFKDFENTLLLLSFSYFNIDNYKEVIHKGNQAILKYEEHFSTEKEQYPTTIIQLVPIISKSYLELGMVSDSEILLEDIHLKYGYWWELVDASLEVALFKNDTENISYLTNILYEKGPFQFFIQNSVMNHFEEYNKLQDYIYILNDLLEDNKNIQIELLI